MPDLFSNLYYAKKNMLMLENLNGNFDVVNKVYETVSVLLKKVSTLDELTDLAKKFSIALKSFIPSKIYDDWFYSDYECYTDKFYHRKFWNEIDNHKSIDDFLEKFLEIFKIENDEENFSVSLYDFNNFEIFFEDEGDLESFVNKFDVEPYTVFRHRGNHCYEMYSA